MKIKVQAHMYPESMYEEGKSAGLSEEAADYFRYFEEITLVLNVDEATGEVTGAKVDSGNF